MTCPDCREAGRHVEVDFERHESNARAVEEKITLRCPECRWTQVYSL